MDTERKPAPDGLEDEFSYLDWLRDTGQVNMFGAAPYLERAFGLDKRKARSVLALWMQAFG